jgi:hypothetical protein
VPGYLQVDKADVEHIFSAQVRGQRMRRHIHEHPALHPSSCSACCCAAGSSDAWVQAKCQDAILLLAFMFTLTTILPLLRSTLLLSMLSALPASSG